MIVYFTGTGNSRYAAEYLAHRLGDRCVDLFHFIRDGVAPDLVSHRPWVFVCPTYGWQLPRVVAQCIRSGRFAGCRDAYFVMTCGSDVGNPVPKNRALCAEKRLVYRGTLPVVMPENYIALFNAPRPAQARRILTAAGPVLEKAALTIAARRDFPVLKTNLLDAVKSGPVNAAFYRFQVKAKAFTVSQACIACGKCVALCPLGNIRLQGGRPIWSDRCTHCMACICGCPAKAIEYGRVSRGKPRYQCPPYEEPEA